MIRNRMPYYIIIIGMLLLMAPAGAVIISNVEISPNKTLMEGDPVMISLSMQYQPMGDLSYDPSHSVTVGTALEGPQWHCSMILDGNVGKPYDLGTGKQETIPGSILAYSQSTFVITNLTLTGTAPALTATSRVPLFKVAEADATGAIIPGTAFAISQTVIQRGDLKGGVYLAQKDLETFKKHIEEKRVLGIDVSAAEAQARDISDLLSYLQTLPEKDYLTGLNQLNSARESISLGDDMLESAHTLKEITRSRQALNQTDSVIGWFTGNKSTENYPGLMALKAGRALAQSNLTGASQAMTAKNYTFARAQAQQGFTIANQTYYDALNLQKKAMDPLTPVYENAIIIEIICFGGILYFLLKPKKKKGTDDGSRIDPKLQESGSGTQGSTGQPQKEEAGI